MTISLPPPPKLYICSMQHDVLHVRNSLSLAYPAGSCRGLNRRQWRWTEGYLTPLSAQRHTVSHPSLPPPQSPSLALSLCVCLSPPSRTGTHIHTRSPSLSLSTPPPPCCLSVSLSHTITRFHRRCPLRMLYLSLLLLLVLLLLSSAGGPTSSAGRWLLVC